MRSEGGRFIRTDTPPLPTTKKAMIHRDLRLAVFERDGWICQGCGIAVCRGGCGCANADHIYPEALGGPTTLENLQTLCKRCNCRKGARM